MTRVSPLDVSALHNAEGNGEALSTNSRGSNSNSPLLNNFLKPTPNDHKETSSLVSSGRSLLDEDNYTSPNDKENSSSTGSSKNESPKSEKFGKYRQSRFVPQELVEAKIKKILSDWTRMKIKYRKNLLDLEAKYKKAEKEDKQYMHKFVLNYAKQYKALKSKLKRDINSKQTEIFRLKRQIAVLQGASSTEYDAKIEESEKLENVETTSDTSDKMFLDMSRKLKVTKEVQTSPVNIEDHGTTVEKVINEEVSKLEGEKEALIDEVASLKKKLQDITEYHEMEIKKKDLEKQELEAMNEELLLFKKKLLEEGSAEEDLDNLIDGEPEEGIPENENVTKGLERTLTQSNLLIQKTMNQNIQEQRLKSEVEHLNSVIKGLREQLSDLSKAQEEDKDKEKEEKETALLEQAENKDKLIEALKKQLKDRKVKLGLIAKQQIALKGMLKDYKNQLEKNKIDLKQKDEDLESQVKLIDELRKQLSNLNEDLSEKTKQILKLNQKLKKGTPQTAENNLKREIKKLQTLQLASGQEVNTLKKKLEIGEKKMEQLNEEFELKTKKYKEQEESFVEKIEEMKSSHSQLIEKLKKGMQKKIEQNNINKNKDMEKLQTKYDSNITKTKALIKEYEKSRRLNEKLEKAYRDLQSKAKLAVGEVKKMKERLKEDGGYRDKFIQMRKSHDEHLVKYKQMEDDLQKAEEKKRIYYNKLEDSKGKIRVYARIRPFNKSETDPKVHKPVVDFLDSTSLLIIPKNKNYTFNRAFDPESTQEAVFKDTKDLIQSSLDGYNVCIFAYGQTGSGKTFTIVGNESFPGLIPRAMKEIFTQIEKRSKRYDTKIEVQMLELYLDSVKDLLKDQTKRRTKSSKSGNIEIQKDSSGTVLVTNTAVAEAPTLEDLQHLYKQGEAHRHVRKTAMNADSSRSHLIFTLHVHSKNKKTGDTSIGKLTFVDLAGSESRKKTKLTDKAGLDEGLAINKSLLALGEVINALASKKSFVPYRGNKLTLMLQDSLGGTAKTLMFVCCGPSGFNVEETCTSLNYAQRARDIKNDVSKKQESKAIKSLKHHIKDLENKLRFATENGGKLPDS